MLTQVRIFEEKIMLQESTLNFLRDLQRNNNRDWFETHKERYREAHADFLQMTEVLLAGISSIDEGVRQSHLQAARCVMRIYRDVRFSADKRPYKDNFFCFINPGGRKSPYAGYYVSIQPGGSFYGGGVYIPDRNPLQSIRERIGNKFNEWIKIVENDGFREFFPDGVKSPSTLKRPPKGWDADHPAIDFLKYKGFFTQRMISDRELTSEGFAENALKAFQSVWPLVQFLNDSIAEVREN